MSAEPRSIGSDTCSATSWQDLITTGAGTFRLWLPQYPLSSSIPACQDLSRDGVPWTAAACCRFRFFAEVNG